MTIMSDRLVEATGLSKLIDRRSVGKSKGIGTGEFFGKIHQLQLKIETQYICNDFVLFDNVIGVSK